MTTSRGTFCRTLLLLAGLSAAACGKRGDPLPPLVRLPVAPPDIKAERRGSTVDVTLTVPASNTDGTKPANIQRVDLYALSGSSDAAASTIVKSGVLVGSVEVKKPRDPNAAVDIDDPDAEVEPPEGPGLDQGATATFQDSMTDTRSVRRVGPSGLAAEPALAMPLVGASPRVPARSYAAVGVGSRGRMGSFSKVASVPETPPPTAPPQPRITYDEKSITLTWGEQAAPATTANADVLPSRSLISTPTKTAYNVYEISTTPASGEPQKDTRLTTSPVADDHYDGRQTTWGVERCFVVRTVETADSLAVEGDPSPKACVTPVDTFPPAAPVGLQAIPLPGGEIRLLWDANSEADLAGYIVMRGSGPDGPTTVITPEPIQATRYSDVIAPNTEAAYAVKAVDKAGNIGPMSTVVVERSR